MPNSTQSWSSTLVEGDEDCIGPSVKQKIMPQMHGNIPYLFDFWANPFSHLLLHDPFFTNSSHQSWLHRAW